MRIERWIYRAVRKLSVVCAATSAGAVAIGAAALTGCGPDCQVETTVTVLIDTAVEVIPDRDLVIIGVSKAEDGDVTGTDERGVPIGPAVDKAKRRKESLLANTRRYEIDIIVSPYPTWYYAFIDNNRDGNPSAGEPLGVDPGNPTDSGCENSASTVTIKPAKL